MSKIKQNTVDLRAILQTVVELPSADVTEYDVYEGTYTVTPKATTQTLETQNKLMQSNVVVEKIPYAEVSNSTGGKTVSIG